MLDLISLSFINYDMQIKKYKKYYNNNNKLILHYNNNNQPIFELKNDDKILMKGDYNFIGIYGKQDNDFRW